MKGDDALVKIWSDIAVRPSRVDVVNIRSHTASYDENTKMREEFWVELNPHNRNDLPIRVGPFYGAMARMEAQSAFDEIVCRLHDAEGVVCERCGQKELKRPEPFPLEALDRP